MPIFKKKTKKKLPWEHSFSPVDPVEGASSGAADILACAASSRIGGVLEVASLQWRDPAGPEAKLAVQAWQAAAASMGVREPARKPKLSWWDKYYLVCAEAESLLRQGWRPGAV